MAKVEEEGLSRRLTVALVHQPVLNRDGEEVVSPVDHYDVMDASRLSLSYPLWRMYVVNRLPEQRALIERLLVHGTTDRGHAERGVFNRTKWAADIDSVIEEMKEKLGVIPKVVCTDVPSIAADDKVLTFEEVRQRISDEGDEHFLLLVGKGWRLADSVVRNADYGLEGMVGSGGGSNLSARSTLAIYIDRLLGS